MNKISIGMPGFTLDPACGRSVPVFTRHREARAECTLAPAEQREFLRALQGELENALQAGGATITTRTNSGDGIELEYTAAALTVCVHVWVVRGDGDHVTVVISIHEDR